MLGIERACKNVCTSTVAVSPDPLSATPSTSALKIRQNTEEDPVDPEPVADGDVKMEYSSH
jgi:hypothetical protein